MGDLFVGYSLIMIKWHKRVPFFLKDCNEILQIHYIKFLEMMLVFAKHNLKIRKSDTFLAC